MQGDALHLSQPCPFFRLSPRPLCLPPLSSVLPSISPLLLLFTPAPSPSLCLSHPSSQAPFPFVVSFAPLSPFSLLSARGARKLPLRRCMKTCPKKVAKNSLTHLLSEDRRQRKRGGGSSLTAAPHTAPSPPLLKYAEGKLREASKEVLLEERNMLF